MSLFEQKMLAEASCNNASRIPFRSGRPIPIHL